MAKVWHVGGEDVYMRIPLLNRLASMGFSVGAIGTGCGARFADTGIEYHDVAIDRGISPAGDIRSLRSLSALFKKHKPDIVHGFDTKPSILTPVAGLRCPDTLVVRTLNGMGNIFSEDTLATRVLRPAYCVAQRLVKNATAHLVFQNEDDHQYFLDHSLTSSSRSSLIRGSGIDVSTLKSTVNEETVCAFRKEFSFADGVPVVTLVARLVRNKGILEFLTAARSIRESGGRAAFLLVGPHASEGSQAVEKSLLDEYADVVTITGPRPDIPVVLAASDLFVLPSYYREGVPRSLLEAASVGLPLIATDMPGCRDVVKEGVNGRLVTPRDAASLTSALTDMLSDMPAWKARARAAQSSIHEQFGIDQVVDAHAALYTRLLKESDR